MDQGISREERRTRMAQKVKRLELWGKRNRGRPKLRWEKKLRRIYKRDGLEKKANSYGDKAMLWTLRTYRRRKD